MTLTSTADRVLRFDSIRADETGLAEMDLGRRKPRPLVRVPRSAIRSLETVFLSGAERPLVVAALGAFLSLVALFPVGFLVAVFLFGGHMMIRLFWFTAFAPLAAWLLWFAFERRWIIRVGTDRGSRKLVFSRGVDPAAARAFVEEVCRSYGYGLVAAASTGGPPLRPGG
jgi:hypothetical protein